MVTKAEQTRSIGDDRFPRQVYGKPVLKGGAAVADDVKGGAVSSAIRLP